jgi:hypothetical protein
MDISIPAAQARLSRNLLIVPVVLLLAGGVLAACGGSKAASNAPVATGSAVASGNGAGNRAGGAAPAAYGLAAEITGSSIEVQDPATGQVTVNFTTSTAFSQTKTVTAVAIKVGGCVTAIGARTGPASGAGGAASPAPSASGQRAAAPTSFTAASVVISPAVNGSCSATAFGGGGRGARPSGSVRPTGARPSGSGGFGSGFGGGGFGTGVASGKVSQLAGSVMQLQVPARGNQPASVDTVTLAASTTYTQTATVTSTALKVGECVSATGKADSSGTVAATRIALSTAGPNGCTTGLGRRPQASASNTGA